jgi:DUF1009 family protein
MAGFLGIIAGRGRYPAAVMASAKKQGVRVKVIAFYNETDEDWLAGEDVSWLRVGQLGKMLNVLEQSGIQEVIMAGQIRPSNLFDLRPDLSALILLAKLKERNAASIFSAIADEIEKRQIRLLPATTYLEDWMAKDGHCAGPKLKPRKIEDVLYGYRIAKAMSALDVGQSVIVKQGTVLAVEAFEGTDPMIRRGGDLGKNKGCVLVKVSKPNQDMRFDVPIIGERTLNLAHESGIDVIAIEAGKTLILDPEIVFKKCKEYQISLWGVNDEQPLIKAGR